MWLWQKRLTRVNDDKNQNAGERDPPRAAGDDWHTVEGQTISFSAAMINDAFVILFWSFHGCLRQGCYVTTGVCLSVGLSDLQQNNLESYMLCNLVLPCFSCTFSDTSENFPLCWFSFHEIMCFIPFSVLLKATLEKTKNRIKKIPLLCVGHYPKSIGDGFHWQDTRRDTFLL